MATWKERCCLGAGGTWCGSFFWESREEVCPRAPQDPEPPRGGHWKCLLAFLLPTPPRPDLVSFRSASSLSCRHRSLLAAPLTLQAQAGLRAFALAAPSARKALSPAVEVSSSSRHLAAFSAARFRGASVSQRVPSSKLCSLFPVPFLFFLKDSFFVFFLSFFHLPVLGLSPGTRDLHCVMGDL